MAASRSWRVVVVSTLLASIAAVLVWTGWCLWPHWHYYNVSRALLNSSEARFWWPEKWREEHDALRALVKGVESKRGVTEFKADWYFQPGTRTSSGESLTKLIKDVEKAGVSRLAVEALTRILADEDQHPSVRVVSAYVLGEIGPDALPAVPALVVTLRETPNPVPDARERVVSQDEAALLFQAGRLRAYAAMAIGRIGPEAKAAIPALLEVASEDQPWYELPKSCAKEALEMIDPQLVVALRRSEKEN
jgi:hypothetical protein